MQPTFFKASIAIFFITLYCRKFEKSDSDEIQLSINYQHITTNCEYHSERNINNFKICIVVEYNGRIIIDHRNFKVLPDIISMKHLTVTL